MQHTSTQTPQKNKSWRGFVICDCSFSCLLMRLLNVSRARQKKRGEKLSPWKIPCRIFTSGISIFPSECCNSNVVFQRSIAFSINLIIWVLMLYICMHFIIHEFGTLLKGFLFSIQAVDNLVLRGLQFSSTALFSSRRSIVQ